MREPKKIAGEPDYVFKVSVTGGTGVGKSNIIWSYIEGQFNKELPATIGVDCTTKTVWVEGKRVKLQIWDTCGQEKYGALSKLYFKGAHAVILVYDITDPIGLKSTDMYYQSALEQSNKSAVIILAGNKTDIEQSRRVKKQLGTEFAQQNGILFFQVSAREGTNIDLMFTSLAEKLCRVKEEEDQARRDRTRENQGRELALSDSSRISKQNRRQRHNQGGCC